MKENQCTFMILTNDISSSLLFHFFFFPSTTIYTQPNLVFHSIDYHYCRISCTFNHYRSIQVNLNIQEKQLTLKCDNCISFDIYSISSQISMMNTRSNILSSVIYNFRFYCFQFRSHLSLKINRFVLMVLLSFSHMTILIVNR